LSEPVYNVDTREELLERYGEYSCLDFERKVLPALGDTAIQPDHRAFKDTSCGIPGASIEDLNCKPFVPIMGGDADFPTATETMLRCFNGTDYLDDFVKEFPKDVFPDFPDGPHEKLVSNDCLRANRRSRFWDTDEARNLSKKLYECLAKFAPKGVWFGYRKKNPKDLTVTADKELGFWSSMDYGYKMLGFLWDQVSAGEHPAFREGKPGKDGKVRVTVPKVSWADGSRMIPLGRFYAAAMCSVYDPQKGNGNKDFILQKDDWRRDGDPVTQSLSCGKSETPPLFGEPSKEERYLVWDNINFVSVPSGKHAKVVPAMSPDPVDYVARFDLASKAGCDLFTTKEVMDGVKKKLSDWLGKYLYMEQDYNKLEDKLVVFNEKVEKCEKEIVAEMKEKREQQKEKDVSHGKPVEAEPVDAGFEL
ncbi:MAG: hypothetical protein II837_00880, partial [Treponema sp.]|nr:hypothetical protein [Treponema sp.]